MNYRAIAGRVLVVGTMTLLGLTTVKPSFAAADAVNTDPVQISPVCSTAADSTATWSAYNKNAFDVTFNWTNKDTGVSGAYDAPANSTTDFTTNYKAGVNNQTEFTNEGSTSPVDRNASNTECAPVVTPPVIPCVDGSDKSNLVTTWNSATGTFTIHTVNNALLCNDVTVYASSYILPANYDGTGFGDPTSYPQQLFDSTSTVLAQGTDGQATLSVKLPDSCNNEQQDLYYAPEITVVGANGHGNQFINGGIVASTGTCQTTPTQPTGPITPTQPVGGMGGGPVATTPVTTTPTVVPTAAPVVATAPARTAATLSDTGYNNRAISMIAATLLAAATLVATRRSKVTE